ncbi:creatininase family protein [Alloacidobacterium sp.]|uniref:creatininase family protein n=1 Tax=Alloacidobacterium sp. TaxID=2951999 RepID=UPI002D5F411A|nr:creatininase family protein [Alloacidobacterium sp.]HYK37728.1 creatininase family protein [Alloacidobacterium sp.]
MRHLALGLLAAASIAGLAQTQSQTENKLSPKWEELTAADFITAIHQSQGVCMLPFGIIEKHGPHLPLGNDLINARYVAEHAAAEEYAVIFPAYYFGQIAEAKQEPGTVSYSMHMQLDLLQETTNEMARNGCKKIVIVNGHGGNDSFLPYFAQSQLQMSHDYVVYIYRWHENYPGRPALHSKVDMHAGESETAHTMVSRPDLVHQDRAAQESGADQARQHLPPDVYTGIWWYARFPNHYAGDGSAATLVLGEADMKANVSDLVSALRAIKADQTSLQLQNEFYEKAQHPLDTKQ